MNIKKIRRGQEVIYIKGDILYSKLALKVYYLEERDNTPCEYYLTTNKEKVITFQQKEHTILTDEEIFVDNDYKKLLKFNEKLLLKYQELNYYLLDKYETYQKANKFLNFANDHEELYNAFGDNKKLYGKTKNKKYYSHSALCNRLIKCPYRYKIKFRINILFRYLGGIIMRIFHIPIFLIDLVDSICKDYEAYIKARHDLSKYKKELLYSPKNEVQERHNNKVIEEHEQKIKEKYEIYSKSNLAFFTFLIAVIALIISIAINEHNISKKENEINILLTKNEKLEQELQEINKNKETEILLNQNQINSNLILTINQLTEIINEMKDREN